MVVVDSDVLIAAIRNNEMARAVLKKYGSKLALSAITVMELYVGAKTLHQKQVVGNIMSDHAIIPLDRTISDVAIRLLKEHNTGTRSLYLPDALIAATCLEHNSALLTFNVKDFAFIKGLKLAG